MQSKLAKLSLVATVVLALTSVLPLSAQRASGQAPKQPESATRAVTYQDTQSSPDQDIEMLKNNLRSQKKLIVAENMDLTDAEAEKFWPVYDRYAADFAKIYDAKIALLQEYLENNQTMSGDEAESYLHGAPRWKRT